MTLPFLLFFLFFFFSFDFLGLGRDSCFFVFLTRCNFFLGHDFYFFNKFRWLIFCYCYLSLFCFNWAFCNKGIWENLFKLIFFIPLLFHFQPNKNERLKSFLPFIIFYPLTFSPFQPNGHLSLRDFKSHCLNQKEIWKEKWEYEKS